MEQLEPQSSPQPLKKGTAAGIKIPRLVRPMTPSTFILRNIGKTIPLTIVIVLAVMLIAGIIALVDSIPLSIQTIYGYTKESLGISPRGNNALLPKLLDTVNRESPVPIDRLIICRASSGQVESIVGKWPFIVLGLERQDMKYYLTRLGSTSLNGRLPASGAAEAVISEPVAINLHLGLGDTLLGPDQENSYSPYPVKVVGIAHTKQWLMLDSKRYQDLYHFPPVDLAIAFAKNRTDQMKLDAWARKRFKGSQAEVFTYQDVQKQTDHMFQTLFTLLDLVIAMLVLVITLMMGLLINIYQSQRLIEFGLLQAIGYTKKRLIARALLENVLIVALGWILGLFTAYWLLVAIRSVLMTPHAFSLDVLDPVAYRYTFPIPITILLTACGSVIWRFREFDPVAVVERRIV